MPNFEIYNWNDIASDFREGGLLLGNGASMALNEERFSYTSILDKARNLGHLTPALDNIFQLLETSDFERVLQGLWQTKHINEALAVINPRITEAYNDVRSALIETVRFIHEKVPYNSVVEPLKVAADYLSQFKIVLSLNYDVLVYWSMLIGNDHLGNHFSDCFVNNKFQHNWENFQNFYSTIVFYPHGNLILGRDIKGVEYKIHGDDRINLLETIIQKWIMEELAPVFVSEGNSEQKKETIDRSPYLSTVFRQVIPELGESVVIYGWSMSEQDNHIIEALRRGSTRRYAISVHLSSNQCQERCAQIQRKFNGFEVIFLNSESNGCWIYPESH